MPPKVLLFGAGAIGTIYVYLLMRAGCDVTAVCRSNYDAVKANGFVIDSALYGKNINVKPKVVRSPTEASRHGPFDYIIVTSKALPGPNPSAPELVAPVVTKERTCIVLIQNGVGIEDEWTSAFPGNPLLSCVVYLPATQIEPGRIEMSNIERLEVGTYPSEAAQLANVRETVDILIETLKAGGGNPIFFDSIQEQRWSKLLINASWNPICALTLSRDVAYLASSHSAKVFVFEVMNECVNVAQALGHSNITSEMARQQLTRAEKRVGGKGIEPSMLVDALWSRRMEVEVIIGNPMRIGQEHGVSVVRLEALYALAKALDESLALRQPGKSLGGDETATATTD